MWRVPQLLQSSQIQALNKTESLQNPANCPRGKQQPTRELVPYYPSRAAQRLEPTGQPYLSIGYIVSTQSWTSKHLRLVCGSHLALLWYRNATSASISSLKVLPSCFRLNWSVGRPLYGVVARLNRCTTPIWMCLLERCPVSNSPSHGWRFLQLLKIGLIVGGRKKQQKSQTWILPILG